MDLSVLSLLSTSSTGTDCTFSYLLDHLSDSVDPCTSSRSVSHVTLNRRPRPTLGPGSRPSQDAHAVNPKLNLRKTQNFSYPSHDPTSVREVMPDLATKKVPRPSSSKQPYSLPQSPRLRAGEETAWAAFLSVNPVLWQDGQVEQKTEALKRASRSLVSPLTPAPELSSVSKQFADQYGPLYHERRAPPTVDFIVDELLPSWVGETKAAEATLGYFASLTAPETSEEARRDLLVPSLRAQQICSKPQELYNVKRWFALQFLSQQDVSD